MPQQIHVVVSNQNDLFHFIFDILDESAPLSVVDEYATEFTRLYRFQAYVLTQYWRSKNCLIFPVPDQLEQVGFSRWDFRTPDCYALYHPDQPLSSLEIIPHGISLVLFFFFRFISSDKANRAAFFIPLIPRNKDSACEKLFSEVWNKTITGAEDILLEDPTRIHIPDMLPLSMKATDYDGHTFLTFLTRYTPVAKSLFFYMILHRLSAGDPVAINVDYGRLHNICLDRAASAGLYNVFPVNILPNTWTITLATSLYEGGSEIDRERERAGGTPN
ncbi:hypothetical protein M422DRAFT_50193 [Sphaerobolus stellatus SS14]|uniref:Uncharacterized protein n=1 Tax=Sphaerobolus stellatus (strain SS14) TaxID=990650 RepID=A0A0C9VKM4_SPHS4|nr:hypothetical protein M422DRAFT_50193 [Sphaerobolus stellatus SS14]